MNAIRAKSFAAAGTGRWRIEPNWPKLPDHMQLDRVSGVAVDSENRVYVAHRGEHPLLCFDSSGRFLREIGADFHRQSVGYDLRGEVPVAMEERHWLHGLHVDPWDNVWVTDVGRHLVVKFDPSGRRLLTLGTDGLAGRSDRQFFQPTHVCVTASGEFFVTDGYGNSRVVKFDAEGRQLLEWGSRGTAQGEFHTPHVITVDRNGLLYVGDRENDRVQIFDQQGKIHGEWPGLHSVDGLHASPDGKLYGAAGLDNALIEFDGQGGAVNVWAEPGFFHYPHGVTVGGDGCVYVAEIAGNRVLKLRSD